MSSVCLSKLKYTVIEPSEMLGFFFYIQCFLLVCWKYEICPLIFICLFSPQAYTCGKLFACSLGLSERFSFTSMPMRFIDEPVWIMADTELTPRLILTDGILLVISFPIKKLYYHCYHSRNYFPNFLIFASVLNAIYVCLSESWFGLIFILGFRFISCILWQHFPKCSILWE